MGNMFTSTKLWDICAFFFKHNYINKCKWNIIELNGDFQIFLRYFRVIYGDLWKTSWNFVVIDGDTRWHFSVGIHSGKIVGKGSLQDGAPSRAIA
jgi:hypothetical protein